VHFVCADDAHGTPIMLAPRRPASRPRLHRGHARRARARFRAFGVAFDQYHTTHSDEKRALAKLIYSRLDDGRLIARRSIQQFYDPVRQMFLPDRYIKGECPNCGAADQYGDNCEVCGKAYAPTDLKNPRSVLSARRRSCATPSTSSSSSANSTPSEGWLAGDVAHRRRQGQAREWLDGGLRDWDISRDAPYFGFADPGRAGQVLLRLARRADRLSRQLHGVVQRARRRLRRVPRAGQHGRDAPLHRQGHHQFPRPVLAGDAARRGLPRADALHVNGISPSTARRCPSRAARSSTRAPTSTISRPSTCATTSPRSSARRRRPRPEPRGLRARVNADLVGKFVNIASRAAGFVQNHFDGGLAPASRSC
jgi:methionyl-tRNA synthetase